MEVADAERFKELEGENLELKKMLTPIDESSHRFNSYQAYLWGWHLFQADPTMFAGRFSVYRPQLAQRSFLLNAVPS